MVSRTLAIVIGASLLQLASCQSQQRLNTPHASLRALHAAFCHSDWSELRRICTEPGFQSIDDLARIHESMRPSDDYLATCARYLDDHKPTNLAVLSDEYVRFDFEDGYPSSHCVLMRKIGSEWLIDSWSNEPYVTPAEIYMSELRARLAEESESEAALGRGEADGRFDETD